LGHERLPRYTRGPAPKLDLSAAELATLAEWNTWDTKLFEAVKVHNRAGRCFPLATLNTKGSACGR